MTTDQPERSARGRTWKVAAAFLAIILLIGGVIVAMSYIRDGSQSAPALPDADDVSTAEPAPRDAVNPSGSPSGAAGGEVAGACDLPVGDQSLPPEAPDARWELIDGAGLPISEEFGPHAQDGDARVCYPRNPTGALFAAANILPRLYFNDEVLNRQVTPGAMRDSVSRDAKGNPREPVPVSTVAYRIDSYSSTEASVVLVAQQSDSLLAVPFRLVWADGDWKGDGSDMNLQPPYEVNGLTGFTPWGSS